MKVALTIEYKIGDRSAFRECYANWDEALPDLIEALEMDVASVNVPDGIEFVSATATATDARLIAAGPKLLACCEHVLTRLDAEAESLGGDNPIFVCGGLRGELRATIAEVAS